MSLNSNFPKLKTRLARFLPSAVLLWSAVIFYRFDAYYKGFLTPTTQKALLAFAISYSVIGLFAYLLLPLKRLPVSKGYIAFKFFKRLAANLNLYRKNFVTGSGNSRLKMKPEERTAVLFLLVKLFFLPLMINFLFQNFDSLSGNLHTTHWSASLFSMASFNNLLFPLIFNAILLVDTAFFAFGYMFEAGFLRNKVRSVDPTYFGWLVCLASYPPFNGLVSGYSSWYANNDNYFSSVYLTFLMRILIIVLMGVYVAASIALGPKASNLTNRGIVVNGPYKFIRHPAYVSKNLAWWLTIIPIFSLAAFLSMLAWSVIYYLRAITEERHLFRDPDYQKYCKDVRGRFVPKADAWLGKRTAKAKA